jgi:hypothetical protein
VSAPKILDRTHQDDDLDRRRTYVAVIVLEAIVIAALWAFSRYFSA